MLKFKNIGPKPERKTDRYVVIDGAARIGRIRWDRSGYMFHPLPKIKITIACLNNIDEFIDSLKEERRLKKGKK